MEERLVKALNWAGGLAFVKEIMIRNQFLLEITSQGNEWLAADLDKQYERVFGILRVLPSPKTAGSSLGNHIARDRSVG